MTTLTRFNLLFLSAVVLSGCSKSEPAVSASSTGENTPIAAFAAGYTNLYKVTPRQIYVNPDLASLCVGASKQQVDAARIRFGPHANAAVLIYMNNLAADAFSVHANRFPVGAVIVKRKFAHGYREQDGRRVDGANGVGGMVKRPAGFDPKHGDWEYFYSENASKVESGRISSCVQCHDGAKDKDYVFATWYKTDG
jgi:hypothetical protein